MSHLKITIRHKRHHYKTMETWIANLSRELQSRWPDIATDLHHQADLGRLTQKALGTGQLLDAVFLVQLERLLNSYTEQTARTIAHHMRAAHLFGVEVAGLGEDALTQPPDAEKIRELARSPRFVDTEATNYLQARAFAHVRNLDLDLIGEFRTLLIEGTYQRENPKQVAHEFGRTLGDYSPRWSTIARTEMAEALNHGSLQQTRALGLHHVYFPEVPGCCVDCKRLIDGMVFPLSSIEGKTNRGIKKEAWQPASQIHPNCVHHPIPASQWLVDQATEIGGGTIPASGIYVPYTPPSER